MRGKILSLWLSGALVAACLAAQAPALGPEFPVNTFTTQGQIGTGLSTDAAGNFVVVWNLVITSGANIQEVMARQFDAAGNPLGAEFQVNTYTTSLQNSGSVASASGGNFVVVWSSDGQDGSSRGVFGRRFDGSGTALGPEFPVNAYTTGEQIGPSIAMNPSGSFVVVWASEGQDGSSYGVYGQRYSSSGYPLGVEFRVNTYTTNSQTLPSVAAEPSGGFVVVWLSIDQGATGYNVFGQRYDGSGNPLGGEFSVDFGAPINPNPQVAVGPSGDFVVAWTGTDADSSGIFGRRYDGTGAPLGGKFLINTHTTGAQVLPRPAMSPTGDLLVTWTNFDPEDGAAAGVFAQRFDVNGRRLGGEFQINGYTTSSQSGSLAAIDPAGQFLIAWSSSGQDGDGLGVFARRGGFPDAAPMRVDESVAAGTSDLNGVLESGERVTVDPAYRNGSSIPLTLSGLGSNLNGPPGPVYMIPDTSANYGTLPAGATVHCLDATADCLQVSVTGTRPVAHWDFTFDESLSAEVTKTWTLHVGESFPDVPRAHPFYKFVENLFHNGITGGCGGGNYCPGNSVTRAQMAVFLLKAEHGFVYLPPACTGVFPDVPCPGPFTDWIEQLFAEGITGGCGGGNYCPNNSVTRAQMAVFLLKAEHGSTYTPPGCAAVFADVPCPSLFADWIEQLFAEGITGGCGGGNYCPSAPNTRGQMAVFLVKTFGLNLYGP